METNKLTEIEKVEYTISAVSRIQTLNMVNSYPFLRKRWGYIDEEIESYLFLLTNTNQLFNLN